VAEPVVPAVRQQAGGTAVFACIRYPVRQSICRQAVAGSGSGVSLLVNVMVQAGAETGNWHGARQARQQCGGGRCAACLRQAWPMAKWAEGEAEVQTGRVSQVSRSRQKEKAVGCRRPSSRYKAERASMSKEAQRGKA